MAGIIRKVEPGFDDPERFSDDYLLDFWDDYVDVIQRTLEEVNRPEPVQPRPFDADPTQYPL